MTNYCCYLTCPCYIRSFCRSRLLARPPSPPASTSWSSSPPTTQPPVFTFLNRFFVCPFMCLCFFLIYLSVLSSFSFFLLSTYIYISTKDMGGTLKKLLVVPSFPVTETSLPSSSKTVNQSKWGFSCNQRKLGLTGNQSKFGLTNSRVSRD